MGGVTRDSQEGPSTTSAVNPAAESEGLRLGRWPGGSLVAMGGGYIGEHADTYHFERPLGGADRWPVQTTAIDERTLALTGETNPRVLLLPTATEDTGRHDLGLFVEAFSSHWSRLGATVDVLRLLPPTERAPDAVSKIEAADAVFVSGGVTHQLLECWQTLGIAEMLRVAVGSGTVLAGSSAGAVCWFEACCSNSHYTYEPYLLGCLGWLDAVICPHWDTQAFRHDAFTEMLRGYRRGIAIDELAALEINGDTYRVLPASSAAWAYECAWHNDQFETRPLPERGALADLASR